jgi:hypothetical protein
MIDTIVGVIAGLGIVCGIIVIIVQVEMVMKYNEIR